MPVKFVKDWKYAWDGIRVEEFTAGAVRDDLPLEVVQQAILDGAAQAEPHRLPDEATEAEAEEEAQDPLSDVSSGQEEDGQEGDVASSPAAQASKPVSAKASGGGGKKKTGKE